MFFFYRYGDHLDLHVLTHSFPTRRSSDLRKSSEASRTRAAPNPSVMTRNVPITGGMISPLRLPVRFISVKTAAAFADPRKNPVGMLQKMPVAAHNPAIPMVNPAKASHGLEISPAASRPPPPTRKPPMRCLPRSCTRSECEIGRAHV